MYGWAGSAYSSSGGADLADLAEVHHRDPVADVLDHGQVVGDEDQREPVARLHVLEQVEDLRLHRDVEGRHRLVADHQLGLEHQGRAIEMRWHWPPENWCGRFGPRHRRVEPDGLEHLVDDLLALLGVDAPVPDAQRLGDDVADLAARVQRRDRVLEDQLDLGPRRRAWPRRPAAVRSVPVEHDPARVGGGQLHDRPAGRRLAAPGLADEPERLAGEDVEADAGDGVDPPAPARRELDDEVLDPQQGLGRGARHGAAGCRVGRPLERARRVA